MLTYLHFLQCIARCRQICLCIYISLSCDADCRWFELELAIQERQYPDCWWVEESETDISWISDPGRLLATPPPSCFEWPYCPSSAFLYISSSDTSSSHLLWRNPNQCPGCIGCATDWCQQWETAESASDVSPVKWMISAHCFLSYTFSLFCIKTFDSPKPSSPTRSYKDLANCALSKYFQLMRTAAGEWWWMQA